MCLSKYTNAGSYIYNENFAGHASYRIMERHNKQIYPQFFSRIVHSERQYLYSVRLLEDTVGLNIHLCLLMAYYFHRLTHKQLVVV